MSERSQNHSDTDERVDYPFYVKCVGCGDVYGKWGEDLAKAEARYHAGYHSSLSGEECQVVVTDEVGVELFRIHGDIPSPDLEQCSNCGEAFGWQSQAASCSTCGHIPEGHRA